jgi:hypothetical protein
MDNLKNLFEHLKKEDRLNFRADNLKKKTLKTKMFNMLVTNKDLHQKFKLGISKLKEVLKDKRSKFTTLRALELIHRRELALKSIVRNKILKSELLNKSNVISVFTKNLNRWRTIEENIDEFTYRKETKIIRKVLRVINSRVRRKQICQKKADKVRLRNEFNTITNMFGQWKESVIDNPQSLFNKTNMLKGAL